MKVAFEYNKELKENKKDKLSEFLHDFNVVVQIIRFWGKVGDTRYHTQNDIVSHCLMC